MFQYCEAYYVKQDETFRLLKKKSNTRDKLFSNQGKVSQRKNNNQVDQVEPSRTK